MFQRALVAVLLLLSLSACSDCCTTVVREPAPRAVELEIEVYDPFTGGVWEGVGVRVVQANQEWSGCVCVSPYANDFALTDRTGLTYFSPFALAAAEVGFVEDGAGQAVLYPDVFEDEADLLLEVWAPGFDPVFVEVPLSYGQPYRFVSVPF
ncbi:MAG: hypothetical protein O2865_16000 [Planctomycetota bacterium]|nr:hypothetical protein [Planctomycetota bacterium]MDA1221115.1 hypothetical protein [Planctomycetota bacterium]